MTKEQFQKFKELDNQTSNLLYQIDRLKRPVIDNQEKLDDLQKPPGCSDEQWKSFREMCEQKLRDDMLNLIAQRDAL